jgi:hypothetical protein
MAKLSKLFIIGFLISFIGFGLAIYSASMNRESLTEFQKYQIREFNSISVILLFIGFLIANIRTVIE